MRQNAFLPSESDEALTDFLAQSDRNLWPIITSEARIVATASKERYDLHTIALISKLHFSEV